MNTEAENILGFIPARGGSVGIPRKNLADLSGKPLLAWTIEAARACSRLDRIIVSTEDEEIANTALNYGAEVPFYRPAELAANTSYPVFSVIHALQWFEGHEGYSPDGVCLLQPTSPFRKAEDIEGTITIAEQNHAEMALSVTESHENPYLMRQRNENGLLRPFMSEIVNYPRRQELPRAYFINGAVYFGRSEAIKIHQTFYPEVLYGHVMPQQRSLQIDNDYELYLARLIASG